ncbi:FHA domain-containing protein [Nocardioides humilatus]|uniref:FHA domain-containing protein n=1 Tax=Nocardioides humilatus TaxID=2607660 RepID=A0A5B1LQ65_9ACTN|nr:FtsK/SpoIIIE domain-containing protein [Nocardioides humilatus]KAA1421747.1 FHA domain-containing protein [Nocardioides humilatus]
MRISCTVVDGPVAVDVLVDCDDATPAAALTAAIRAELGIFDQGGGSCGGTVANTGLLHGDIIEGDGTPRRTGLPAAGLQLHVVGGPQSGFVYALPIGTHEIGRSSTLAWNDTSLSRRHCALAVTADGVAVTDLGSSNGTVLDGARLPHAQGQSWLPGQLLEIGDSLVELRLARGSETVVEPAEPGWANFLRPPRVLPHVGTPSIEVPRPPTEHKPRRLPVIAMILPIPFAIVMAVIYNPLFLMFAFMSPMMMLGNYISDRVGNAKDYKAEVEKYHLDLAAAQDRLTEAIDEEQRRLRALAPDAGDVFVTALLPGKRLWERRRHDPDFLEIRLGTADLPSSVRLTGAQTEHDHVARAVPAGFSLVQDGVVGIAGPDSEIDDLARWVVAQLAVHHAPRDLSLSFLTARGGSEWSWLSWLPHLRPDDPEAPLAMIGLDDETRTAQVAALSALIAEREQFQKEHRATQGSFPAHVVVLHGYRELRAIPGLNEVLVDGPPVGVFAVCVAEHEKALPERCTATFQVDAEKSVRGVLRRSGELPIEGLLREGVSAEWADRVARAIAPLRDVGATQEGSSLPDAARLLDVLALDPPTPEAIRAGWVLRPQSTEMVLGIGLTGSFSLDLKVDGPHGLIAGMTGSGKTELLQTIVASLAVANRPDAMNFVLVDYKGDSAFKAFAEMPHVVGKVNDLDQHLVVRALASLKAELKYREHFLAKAETKDIEDYQRLRSKEPHRPALPRLLIVIDEFAQLFKDLPDFVNGLVSISQLGRSMGIHLLLATQRPSGVVSPEIQANTNMRIALRVRDASDSTDVIDVPDAFRISKSTPGRAYARLGASTLQPFQSGRVGGRRPGAAATDLPPPFVARLAWSALGYPPPTAPARKETEVDETDLAALVAAVVGAGRAEDVPAQRSPWLPPMATRLVLPVSVPFAEGVVPPFPYGLSDLPSLQQQCVAYFDLDRDGHLLVIGSPRSGRSQVLRTLAGSIAMSASPVDVHLYGIDCGNGALNALAALPHTGSVVSRTEGERAARLLARIGEEMDARQRLLAEREFGDITEQRSSGLEPLPHLVVMLDRWEAFIPTLGEDEDNAAAIMRILREGASLGVHLVITGDRSLPYYGRLAAMTENKLTLRLAEKDDYGLVGLNPRQMPDQVPDGRGFRPGGIETQVYVLADDVSGQAQAAALVDIGARATGRSTHTRPPFRVDSLPSTIGLDAVLAINAASVQEPFAAVGVGGDELSAYGLTRAGGTSFIVGGPGRSGRSTVLLQMALSWLATGGMVVGVAPRPSVVRSLEEQPGVLSVLTGDGPPDQIASLVESADQPVLIVVDDAEGLRMADIGDYLVQVARGTARATLAVAGDADALSSASMGWLNEARKARRGLLLSPQAWGDGDAIGFRLPRSLVGGAPQPGRGWLHMGDGRLIQVATIAPAIG